MSTPPATATLQVLPNRERLFRALIERDSQFDGLFVAAVKTTGIFCRPTCHARKPKPENVEFYPSPHDALLAGYRPCLLCHPMCAAGEAPSWLEELLERVHEHPEERIKDGDLREMGIDPARARRWFNKHHGMTFHAYCRALRIGQAFGQIRDGRDVTSTAFNAGYGSLSGFAESFKSTVGFSPSLSRRCDLAVITRIPTPLGLMLAGATEDGICLLEFVDRRMLETQLARLRKLLDVEFIPGTSPHFATLRAQLDDYFDGTRASSDVPLVVPGTEFQQRAWDALQTIPYGETRSYQQQAEAIGRPEAVRAVARANGDNRIAILIPCHRVIGKNGKLTGYGGGLWRKQYLLDLEAKGIVG